MKISKYTELCIFLIEGGISYNMGQVVLFQVFLRVGGVILRHFVTNPTKEDWCYKDGVTHSSHVGSYLHLFKLMIYDRHISLISVLVC